LAVAGVRTATSATRQNMIDSARDTWDGEALVVSKHAENLVQAPNPPSIPPSGWKCQEEGCTLDNNLWLNLTDGTIKCGRRFFDGSGGNNHAVDHYKDGKGGGPLAVKLGTITRDGKADVFSYDEDDMVLDPFLEKHMLHFGIKIASLEKTDKSMVEIEIDMNARIGEWAILTESGSKLVPVWGPSKTGLHNLGNTCYMNSMLQVLFSIPEWVEFYKAEKWLDRGSLADPASDLALQLAKLCRGLVSGEYSHEADEAVMNDEGSQPGIKPLMFKQLIGRGHHEFSSNRQQDSQEFFMHLLDQIEKCHHKLAPASAAPLTSCLQFQVEDRVQCGSSGAVKYSKRVEDWLPLAIPIEAATKQGGGGGLQQEKNKTEAKGERLSGDEMVRLKIPADAVLTAFAGETEVADFYSSAIKGKTTARKSVRMVTFPPFLLLQLQKFTTDATWQPVKLDCSVDMPNTLDISFLKAKGLQPGEVEMPQEDESSAEAAPAIAIDENVVLQLVDMGFGREGCRRAVHKTGNTGVEAAMAWVMEHMGDDDFNDPFQPEGGAKKSCTAGEEVVAMVMSMGFSREQAEMGLRNTDNNVERAVDWIFNHPDGEEASGDGPGPNQSKELENLRDGEPRYELQAFVSHMGTSNHSGHYVCHIKDPEDPTKWIIFNDNKVAVSVNPPKELGYLYLYKRATV